MTSLVRTMQNTDGINCRHLWCNSIGVRMQREVGYGWDTEGAGRALICQAEAHQWSVNGTHESRGPRSDSPHPLSGSRHIPSPRHGGRLRAKATGRVNGAWPKGHTQIHTSKKQNTPAWRLALSPCFFGRRVEWRFAATSQVLLRE